MDHNFNVEVAKLVGISPATILNSIYWWIEKNKVEERNYHDGHYWTFMSRKGYCKYFPYLTERQIEYALRKLVDEGFLVTGNYNKSAYDRTLWYRLTSKSYSILQNCEIEAENLLNEDNKNVKPIPDNKTYTKTNKNSLSLDKEEQAPETKKYKNYGEIFSASENSEIRLSLEKFVKSLKNKHGYNPKITTVAKFADTLRNISSNNPELAMRIVDQSIDKGWKDLYKLKDKHSRDAVSTAFNPEKDALAKDNTGNNLVY